MDKDHHFIGHEQAEYDSLTAAGRTYYDDLRWLLNLVHAEAFSRAVDGYGLKKKP